MRVRSTDGRSWEPWMLPSAPASEECRPLRFFVPRLQDCFFYSLVFDPVQKTLLADQGEIRVGCKYQAEIPDRLAEGKQQDESEWPLSPVTSSSP